MFRGAGWNVIKVIWGPAQIPLPLPEAMRGSLLIGDAAIEKYRLVAVAVGRGGIALGGAEFARAAARVPTPHRSSGAPGERKQAWAEPEAGADGGTGAAGGTCADGGVGAEGGARGGGRCA